mmetsp:Transcript_96337/g.274540  ORF Transcript_96337/g.274540 Transcript_96337/m.274540 type:complete len:200 (-) Transcript_96337:1326-1925(-)
MAMPPLPSHRPLVGPSKLRLLMGLLPQRTRPAELVFGLLYHRLLLRREFRQFHNFGHIECQEHVMHHARAALAAENQNAAADTVHRAVVVGPDAGDHGPVTTPVHPHIGPGGRGRCEVEHVELVEHTRVLPADHHRLARVSHLMAMHARADLGALTRGSRHAPHLGRNVEDFDLTRSHERARWMAATRAAVSKLVSACK